MLQRWVRDQKAQMPSAGLNIDNMNVAMAMLYALKDTRYSGRLRGLAHGSGRSNRTSGRQAEPPRSTTKTRGPDLNWSCTGSLSAACTVWTGECMRFSCSRILVGSGDGRSNRHCAFRSVANAFTLVVGRPDG